MVNKVMIIMHIVAYFFLVVVNALQCMPVAYSRWRSIEIAGICAYVVYFVCTLVFGLIVNTLVPNIKAADIQGSLSIPSSLIS